MAKTRRSERPDLWKQAIAARDKVEAGNVPVSDPHPKNVRAVLDWVKTNRPDCLRVFELLFASNDAQSQTEAVISFCLIGFEAGRAFEKNHPNIESGIGYAS
jgi:hypothetical protein